MSNVLDEEIAALGLDNDDGIDEDMDSYARSILFEVEGWKEDSNEGVQHKELVNKIRESSAIKIQCVYRGVLDRRKFKSMRLCKEEEEEGMYIFVYGSTYYYETTQTNTPYICDPLSITIDGSSRDIKDIACGYHFNLALKEDGRIYQWGNDFNTIYTIPTHIPINDKVIAITCGAKHSIILTNVGHTYSWGCGLHGRLGHGDSITRNKPTLIKSIPSTSKVKHIYAGGAHNLYILEDSSIIVFGFNKYGQCGMGWGYNIMTPNILRSASLDGIIPINASLGRNHTLILSDDGIIYSCGHNEYICLGRTIESHPASIGPSNNFSSTLYPIKSLQHSFIHHISAGKYHNLALDVNGSVYVWGDNSEGQCGISLSMEEIYPTQLKIPYKVESICSGSYHSGIITCNGYVYMFGSGDYGALGLGMSQSLFYTQYEPQLVDGISNLYVYKISCGGSHTIIQAKDRKINRETDTEGEAELQLQNNKTSFIDISDSDISVVFSYCRHNRLKEMKDVLDAGFKIDSIDSYGNTLLIIASQNNLKSMCELLIRSGSKINVVNYKHQGVLHYCYEYGFIKLAKYLIRQGADETIVTGIAR